MRLVLWDIDGTLVHTAGYGRDAFGEAFAVIFGRQADLTSVSMGGRTDHDIAMEVLAAAGVADGDSHVPRMLDELAVALDAVRERIGLPPEECVFVDDLRENCEGAEAEGMIPVLHRGADTTIPRLEELLGVELRS